MMYMDNENTEQSLSLQKFPRIPVLSQINVNVRAKVSLTRISHETITIVKVNTRAGFINISILRDFLYSRRRTKLCNGI